MLCEAQSAHPAQCLAKIPIFLFLVWEPICVLRWVFEIKEVYNEAQRGLFTPISNPPLRNSFRQQSTCC